MIELDRKEGHVSFWKKPAESAEWLASVAFFEGFAPEELERVAALCGELSVPTGSLLMDQGDAGQDCYVIVEGQASVYVRGEHIATLGPGSMVGEMALVDHKPRIASVVTDSDARLLRFSSRQFKQLLDEMPKASERVMTVLGERLKAQEKMG